ncbi:MAG TPA: hypothetical protein VGR62_12490 [Candidatus Binatia bacterium]|jgi:hypothetical protein|nr:hypothetical protein [Candidatus Binatia bacterium]
MMDELAERERTEDAAGTELRATRFTLVDSVGRARAALGPADDGSTGLLLFDAQERPRAQMVLDGSGQAHVKLHDRDGDVAAWLAVGRSGAPSLYLRGVSRTDRAVRGHAEICVDEHGCPVLSLHDREGQPRVLLSLDERDGRPGLSFSDALGNSRLVLSEDGTGGLLYLYDREGQSRDGVPRLPLGDPPPVTAAPPSPDARVAASDGDLPSMVDRITRLERSRRRGRLAAAALVLIAAGLGGIGGAAFAPELRRMPAPSPIAVAPIAVAPIAAAPAPVVAAAPSRVLEAEEFVLTDGHGGTRARLSLMPDGWPYLQLSGPDGQGIVQLAVLPGPDVLLRLSAGNGTVLLAASADGPPSLSLYEGDRVVFQAPAGLARFPPPSVWP